MPDNWKKTFDELRSFIAQQPTIEISMNAICIPSDVRPEFYRLFNAVRADFVQDNYPTFLKKGYVLSKNWGEVKNAVIDTLRLESIDVPESPRWFLQDPSDGTSRALIDPLFDVLKGKRDLGAFELTAAQLVESEFAKCFSDGYKLWAIMSMITLLSADKAYQVPIEQYNNPEMADVADEKPGNHKEYVPDTRETNMISFVPGYLCTFLVPMVIAHSKRLNLFVSLRSDFREARWMARKTSLAQEWLPIPNIIRESGQTKLWPDLVVYSNTDRKELNLIADYWQIARPDVIVEFKEETNWNKGDGLEIIKRHCDALKPKLGCFIVCLEDVDKAAIQELESKSSLQYTAEEIISESSLRIQPNIHLIRAGYDVTKLEPIIEALNKGVNQTEESEKQ